MSNAVWRTKDGRRLSINKMDTVHLQNTIRFLDRQIAAVENSLEMYNYFDDCEFPVTAEKKVRAFVNWAEHKQKLMRDELKRRSTFLGRLAKVFR